MNHLHPLKTYFCILKSLLPLSTAWRCATSMKFKWFRQCDGTIYWCSYTCDRTFLVPSEACSPFNQLVTAGRSWGKACRPPRASDDALLVSCSTRVCLFLCFCVCRWCVLLFSSWCVSVPLRQLTAGTPHTHDLQCISCVVRHGDIHTPPPVH